MNKKVTVIVPVYNAEDSIEKCLLSLCHQTLDDLLIMVINDGSTDKTEEVVLNLQQKYPDKIEYYYKQNEGIASTRNFGVSHVKTEYFGFLDSDDYVDPTMFEKMLKQIEKDQSDICLCDFYWVYPENQRHSNDGPYQDKKDLLINMFATLWNKLYRTRWIQELNLTFPDGLRYEDASFLYRLVPFMNKVSYVSEPFVYYVQRPGSITHTFNVNIQDMIHVFTGILDYYQTYGYYAAYQEELEYLFVRFFLGNSYLRAVRIIDKQVRDEVLSISWNFLNEKFPNWKKNSYLKKPGKKNMYYRFVNKTMYDLNVYLFKALYCLRILK